MAMDIIGHNRKLGIKKLSWRISGPYQPIAIRLSRPRKAIGVCI